MAHTIESQVTTVADELRNALSEAERQLSQPSAANVETLLLLCDKIEHMLAAFDQFDPDDRELRGEQSRWESLQGRLQTSPGAIARAASAAGGMKSLRAKNPPATGFWWHLDELHASRMRQSIQRLVTTVVTIAVVVFGGWQLVNYLFPPDPVAVALLEADNQIENFVATGDFESALGLVEEMLQSLPEAPELLIWSIVLAEKLDDQERAARDLAKVLQLNPDQQPQIWTMLGTQRFQLGDLDGAEAAANQSLALAADDPQAYLLLATIAEGRGDVTTAIAYFEKTYEFAQDNPQLQVVARYRMGQLMQQAPMIVSPTPTITP